MSYAWCRLRSLPAGLVLLCRVMVSAPPLVVLHRSCPVSLHPDHPAWRDGSYDSPMTTSGTADHGLRLIPFHGLRYVPERVGSLAAVTSPPYDVVVRPDGLDHLESADPHNIVRLILPQADTPDARNLQAARTLRDWLAEGILSADPEPALYVYEQRKGDLLQRGIIGALALSTADSRHRPPHEDVMPHVVTDRAGLMRATSANLEPLLLTYLGDDPAAGAAALVERTARSTPLFSTTTEDGFQHRLWAISDPMRPGGHHRRPGRPPGPHRRRPPPLGHVPAPPGGARLPHRVGLRPGPPRGHRPLPAPGPRHPPDAAPPPAAHRAGRPRGPLPGPPGRRPAADGHGGPGGGRGARQRLPAHRGRHLPPGHRPRSGPHRAHGPP